MKYFVIIQKMASLELKDTLEIQQFWDEILTHPKLENNIINNMN